MDSHTLFSDCTIDTPTINRVCTQTRVLGNKTWKLILSLYEDKRPKMLRYIALDSVLQNKQSIDQPRQKYFKIASMYFLSNSAEMISLSTSTFISDKLIHWQTYHNGYLEEDLTCWVRNLQGVNNSGILQMILEKKKAHRDTAYTCILYPRTYMISSG